MGVGLGKLKTTNNILIKVNYKIKNMYICYKMDGILFYEELISHQPNNDSHLAFYMNHVLNWVGNSDVLTPSGFSIISCNLNIILEKITKSPENQRNLFRGVLYMTISNILAELFLGYLSAVEAKLPNVKVLPEPQLRFAGQLKTRIQALIPIYERILRHWQGRLSDRYAKLYNMEKRRCFSSNLFNTVLVIPSVYPEGYENAKEVK